MTTSLNQTLMAEQSPYHAQVSPPVVAKAAPANPLGRLAWDRAKEAPLGAPRDPWLQEGQGHLKVESCELLHTRKSKDAFLIRFIILTHTAKETHKPGSLAVVWIDLANIDMAPKNLLNFAQAVTGEQNSNQIDWTTLDAFTQPAQPIRGTEVLSESRNVLTKRGTTFTTHFFAGVKGRQFCDITAAKFDPKARPLEISEESWNNFKAPF